MYFFIYPYIYIHIISICVILNIPVSVKTKPYYSPFSSYRICFTWAGPRPLWMMKKLPEPRRIPRWDSTGPCPAAWLRWIGGVSQVDGKGMTCGKKGCLVFETHPFQLLPEVHLYPTSLWAHAYTAAKVRLVHKLWLTQQVGIAKAPWFENMKHLHMEDKCLAMPNKYFRIGT